MSNDDDDNPAKKHEREQEELKHRIAIVKALPMDDAGEVALERMISAEKYWVDSVTLLKSRATKLFKKGALATAAGHYTRAIGLHAIRGDPASHTLYSNRSACRCGLEDFEGALADAEECIRLDATWGKGYVRKGAALHGLYRLDEAVCAYDEGLVHEPTLAALTDGRNDALRRQQAAGGHWQAVRVEQQRAAEEPPTCAQPNAMVLVPVASSSVLCVDGARALLVDGTTAREIRALAAGRAPIVIAACCGAAGEAAEATAALYTAEAAPDGLLCRSRWPLPEPHALWPPPKSESSASLAALGLDAPPRGLALGESGVGGEATAPALYVCDSAGGRVLTLDPTHLTLRSSFGTHGSADGQLNAPLGVAASGGLVAIADAANYRVALFTAGGTFVRNVGERASRFASAARPGQFTKPPAHVALVAEHLFVLEGGGATHVHVLDPASGAPKALLQPPYNAARGAGCLSGLCASGDSLFVSTRHREQLWILRLPREQPSSVGEVDATAGALAQCAVGEPRKNELAYKKGFLLGVS